MSSLNVSIMKFYDHASIYSSISIETGLVMHFSGYEKITLILHYNGMLYV